MKLLIRADASSQIGTGHVMRCLALAQAWQSEGGQVYFLMATTSPALEARLQDESFEILHHTAPLGSPADAEQTIKLAHQLTAQTVVIDGYHFGAAYQRQLKAAGLRLLFIDDNGHAEHYVADWVLNQNIHAHKELYGNRESYTQLLLGTRYALLRKEFWPWRGWQRQIAPVGQKVLVTLGGSDPENVTFKVIRALQQVALPALEGVVVVGGSNPHFEALQAAVKDAETKIVLQRNVTNMPELMAWADMAIAAGGSTCWELAFMGLPSLLIVLARNQLANAYGMQAQRAMLDLGWYFESTEDSLAQKIVEIIESRFLRAQMATCTKRLVDGEGTSRVLMALKEREINLRKANWEDCEKLWHWANEPDARSESFSPHPIPWDEHIAWFKSKLSSRTSLIYIGSDLENVPIGTIRFDLFDLEDKEAIVSVNIDRRFRGQGYGTSLICLSIKHVAKAFELKKIIALIKSNNYASIKAFEKAGFLITDFELRNNRSIQNKIGSVVRMMRLL